MAERNRMQEALEKLARLESREQALQQEKAAHLYSKRHEFHSKFCSLEEADLKLCAQRKSEKLELKQQIERIRNSVSSFKRLLADMKPGPVYVERLKLTMEEIESSMLAFKERQQGIYETLLQEERLTSLEVSAFERKLEAWLTTQQPTTTTTGLRNPITRVPVQASVSAMPPAVVSFERFLQQTGGRQGGWDDYDHQTFLRTRKQFGGQAGYIEKISRELPTKSLQDVEQHEQWYTEYCTLLESKRRAIQTWKSQRKLAKVGQLSKVDPSEDKGGIKGPTTKDVAKAKEMEEKHLMLNAWKAERELQKHIQTKEEKLRADMEKARKEEKEKKRREALKLQMEAYARTHEEERVAQQQLEEDRKEEERRRRRLATREVERFRERDLRAAEERRERKKAKDLEEEERLITKKNTVVTVHRDPSRLYKLTAALEERRKAASESGNCGIAVSIPKRAIPSWRQGL